MYPAVPTTGGSRVSEAASRGPPWPADIADHRPDRNRLFRPHKIPCCVNLWVFGLVAIALDIQGLQERRRTPCFCTRGPRQGHDGKKYMPR